MKACSRIFRMIVAATNGARRIGRLAPGSHLLLLAAVLTVTLVMSGGANAQAAKKGTDKTDATVTRALLQLAPEDRAAVIEQFSDKQAKNLLLRTLSNTPTGGAATGIASYSVEAVRLKAAALRENLRAVLARSSRSDPGISPGHAGKPGGRGRRTARRSGVPIGTCGCRRPHGVGVPAADETLGRPK